MDEVVFKGIVKFDSRDDCWYAEDKDGIFINENILTGMDYLLEEFEYDQTDEGDELEIIIKVKRAGK